MALSSLVEQYIDAAITRGLHCGITISRATEMGLVQRYTFNYCPQWQAKRDVFFLSMINPCNLLETDYDAFQWEECYSRDALVFRMLCKVAGGWRIGLLSQPLSGTHEDSDSDVADPDPNTCSWEGYKSDSDSDSD